MQNYAKHAEKQVYMTWSKMPEVRTEVQMTSLPPCENIDADPPELVLSDPVRGLFLTQTLVTVTQSDICTSILLIDNSDKCFSFISSEFVINKGMSMSLWKIITQP